MKTLLIVVGLLFLAGCPAPKEPLHPGCVTLTKENGNLTTIDIRFPQWGDCNTNHTIRLRNRKEVVAMSEQLQAMLKDLEYGKEQMPVEEEVGGVEVHVRATSGAKP